MKSNYGNYSDKDARSLEKAYAMFERGRIEVGTVKGLQDIHRIRRTL